MEWDLQVTYGLKPFVIKAVLEYHSSQIMRIRVHGSKSSMLLENNYPLLKLANSGKGWNWKIREGKMDEGNMRNAELLTNILSQLEHAIKINGENNIKSWCFTHTKTPELP